MNNSSKNIEPSIQKFKETIARKYGKIRCWGPNDEYAEVRSLREAEEVTGVHHNSIDYALKHSGRTKKGWRFERYAANQSEAK